ncbi:MAG: HIT family protein [Candidatus Nanoarchaeia archaeon]|jgi:histidine triad (HIT) family protein|nr:HIT family protein [Candidatus Nanoarchaeia archaeon]|tara:strand:- start:1876 stop:2286 length:411 start_codon:yes stop_codon:yes gene_type:complete
MKDCLFCKIINKEIQADIVYEDDSIIAFLDLNPVNKGHTLLVPKKHSNDFLDMNKEDLEHFFSKAQEISKAIIKSMDSPGLNFTTNIKEAAGQVIFHTHFHLMPRFENDNLKLWYGKRLENTEMKEIASKIKSLLK